MNEASPSARKPEIRERSRIRPLAVLPVFMALEGRRAILAGSGDGLVWKAELIAAAGAFVELYWTGAVPGTLVDLVRSPPAGSIALQTGDWRHAGFAGAAIALGDFHDDQEAHAFRALARSAGVPVNMVDRPALCDVQFGTIVNRSPLVIGISTAGAAPVFGQAIRIKIEALLPGGLAAWAQAARDWRPIIQARALGFRTRRLFWERFTALALTHTHRQPNAADRADLLAGMEALPAQAAGRVSLVGAGPGDPELLTLKAVRTLQSADIILYDDLVSSGVLDLARRESRRMLVGKTGHGPACKQSEINDLMVRLAVSGKHVVRLKSGDPGIFGRAGEEIDACLAKDIPVELIPGITSAQGAAAVLGLSLTQRLHARRIQFLTGHGADGKLPADMNWPALADPGATSIIYMPRGTIEELVSKAVRAGLDPATPALAIQNATRPTQSTVWSHIGELPDAMTALGDGPMLVMIGLAFRQGQASLLQETGMRSAA